MQYKGKLSTNSPDVYDVSMIMCTHTHTVSSRARFNAVLLHGLFQWEQFLQLGSDVETSDIEERMKCQKPNQCAALVYTVRRVVCILIWM